MWWAYLKVGRTTFPTSVQSNPWEPLPLVPLRQVELFGRMTFEFFQHLSRRVSCCSSFPLLKLGTGKKGVFRSPKDVILSTRFSLAVVRLWRSWILNEFISCWLLVASLETFSIIFPTCPVDARRQILFELREHISSGQFSTEINHDRLSIRYTLEK